MAEAPDFAFELYIGRARIVRRVGAADWIAEITDPPVEGSRQAAEPVTAIRLAIEAAVGCPVRIRELQIVNQSITRRPLLIGQEVRFEAEVLREATLCPDCKGSGQYVGFTALEPCTTCGGSGWAR